MCWCSRNCIKQVAKEDISAFKIVWNDKKSLYKSFPYKENIKYSLGKEININNEGGIYSIYEGFHSYCKKCEITPYSDGFFRVIDLVGTVSLYYSDHLILECLIPKGAIYYINVKGECVSDKLKTLKFYKIDDYINIR